MNIKKLASRAGGALSATAIAALIVLVTVAGVNANTAARAEIAHEHLLSTIKVESGVAQSAADEDAALAAQTEQAQAVAHTDQLAAEAEAAYQAKLAAERAAAEAAAAAAAQAAAEQAAAQQAQQSQSVQAPADNGGSDPAAPSVVKCPAGTIAGAVDADGNESNCSPLGPTGTQCVAYNADNVCTQWYDPNK